MVGVCCGGWKEGGGCWKEDENGEVLVLSVWLE